LDKICDITIGIIAADTTKLDRICKRDNIDQQTAQKRINIQLKDKYLAQHSDYIIENNSDLNKLEKKIEDLNLF